VVRFGLGGGGGVAGFLGGGVWPWCQFQILLLLSFELGRLVSAFHLAVWADFGGNLVQLTGSVVSHK